METNLKILLAEDNKFNQQLMLRILLNLGCKAALAENGIQVLRMMDHEDFDIILMDIQMPEMDGLAATKLIRSHYPKEKQPMIVALTAETSKGDNEIYINCGMDSVLTKPIQLDDLNAILEGFSSRKVSLVPSPANTVPENLDKEIKTLDNSILKELLTIMGEEGKDFLIQMVELYKKEAPKTIEQMKEAKNRNDIESLLKLLHKLRGSSGQTGAVKLGNLCQTLETQLKQSVIQDLDKRLFEINQENTKFIIELEEYLKGLS
jgi:CheY-like chemotaxis protein